METIYDVSFMVDGRRPSAVITVADNALKTGETSPVTSNDDEVTWTATFKANSRANGATHVISVNSGGVADEAANPVAGKVDSNNCLISSRRSRYSGGFRGTG
jgi:hypothetical protein